MLLRLFIPLLAVAAIIFMPATAPAATTLSASPSSLAIAGSACIQTQSVQITATSSVNFSAAVTSGNSWLLVSQNSAKTPATLTITAFPQAASTTGNIRVTSTGLLPVDIPIALSAGTGSFALSLCGSQNPVGKVSLPVSRSATDKDVQALVAIQDITLTASGSGSHKFSSSKDAKWLSISAGSGTVTGGDTGGVDIQVFVDASGLPHNGGNTYNGSVTISAGGQNVTISVVLSVTGCDLSVIPDPIPTVTPGHQKQSSISLRTSSGVPESVTFSATTSDGGTWLTVTNSNHPSAAGTATVPPDNLNVNVNAANLNQGVYTGTVMVGNCTPAPCTSVTKDISVTVSPANLNASTLLPFSGTAPNPPATQTVQITASDASAMSFTYSVSTDNAINWLQVKPTGTQTTPVNLSISAVPGTLAAGTYKGTIQLTPANGSQPLPINVSFTIVPTVTATPSSLSFPAAGPTPLQQTVTLTSDTTAGIGFSHTATTADNGTWLKATASTTNIPATLTVTVSPSGLKPGIYNGAIQISPGSPVAPVTVKVTYTVGNSATLSIDPSAISFSGQVGGSSCGQLTRPIQSSDTTAPLSYQATAAVTSPPSGNWLTVSPPSGNTPDNLSIACSVGGLGAGKYAGLISVSVPNSSNPAISIPVNLDVAQPPIITPSPASLSFDYNNNTSASTSGLSQVVRLTSATQVNFTATATSGQTWISVLPATGATDGSITVTVDPGQLIGSSTPYQGKVTIGNGNTTTDLNVSFSISGTPRLTRLAPLSLDGGGFQTSYLLLNPTSNPASYSISLSGVSPGSGTISPMSTYALQTPGIASQTVAGWSEMTFDSGVGGFGLTQSTSGSQQESVIPLLAAPVAHFYVPFDNTSGRATSLNVVERAPGLTASCKVNGWTTANGPSAGVAQVQAGPRVSKSFDVTTWDAFNNTQGVAELVCDRPVFAATVRINQSGSVAVHDVVAAGTGDRTVITRQIPAVLDGPSYQSVFALVNTDTISQAYSFQFWNNRNGGSFSSPLEAQNTGTIPPGGVVFLTSDSSGTASSLLAQLAGPLPFAELTAARTVAAFVIYQQGIDGSTISAESAVPVTQTAARHWTVPLSGSNLFSTAVSILNSNNNQAANLTLTYYVGGGPAMETMSVPAGGSILLQVAGDPIAAGLDGILDLVSDQSVNALVFRIAPDNSFAAFSPLPAN